jgi:putative peptidoglycan lipid II flippase
MDSVVDAGGDAQAVLAKRGGAYGLGTFISRLLGLAREVLIASDLGTSGAASGLVVSQTIPNLARTLVADDISQGVLVPVFSRKREEVGVDAVANLGLLVSIVSTAFMIGIGIVVLFLAEPLVQLIGPGITAETRKQVVIPLLRIFAITLAFGGLGTVGSAYLILRHRYFGAAVAVAASNVPVVLVLLIFRSASVTIIAISLAAGVVIQAIAQRVIGGRLGASRPSLSVLRDRDAWLTVRRIAALSLPVAISLGMANLSGVIDTAYCSLVSTGGPAAFDKAFRLVLVPYGIIALAIGVAVVNTFIGSASQPKVFTARMSEAVRLQFALLIPLAAAVTVYARPLITLMFARGSFNAQSVDLTTNAMRGLGIVLPALGLSALGTRAWTTRERPWIPAFVGIGGLACNLGLDAALYRPLGLAGIALSTAAVHFSVGGLLIVQSVEGRMRFVGAVIPIMLWALVVGAVICVPMAAIALVGYSPSTTLRLVALAVGCLMALATALACPDPEYRLLLRGLLRRR